MVVLKKFMDMVTSFCLLNLSSTSSQLLTNVVIFQNNEITLCITEMQGYLNFGINMCIHHIVPLDSMLVCERIIVIGGITPIVHMVPGVKIQQIVLVILSIMFLHQNQQTILLGGTNYLLIYFVCIDASRKCGNLKRIYAGGASLNINSAFI